MYNSTNGGNINETNQKNKTILSKSFYDANERSIDDRRGNQSNVEEISDITGLSIEELEKLKNEIV